jgi:ABC-type nickel/cobalt efflux system permease component RcnA
LIAKGVSPGAVLVGLLLGPATNLATLIFLRSSFGLRATLVAVLSIILASWAMAFGVNVALPVSEIPLSTRVAEHADSWLSYAAAGLLAVLLVRSMWRSGTRAWLASMLHSGDDDHAHSHTHSHRHAHSHAHGSAS